MEKFKKNQIVVYAIVLMLVVAGYLNYIENDKVIEISADTQRDANIGDATLVSNNETNEEVKENDEEEKNEGEKVEDESKIENISDANSTITINTDDEYFANSKLEREKMYSQMLETYQKILENASISEEQKSIASTEITKISNTKNAIMICENLIAIKGFEETVIFVNGDSVNIVVKAKELTTEEIAQIQNIVTREIKVNIENIHIMKK